MESYLREKKEAILKDRKAEQLSMANGTSSIEMIEQ